MTVDLVDHDERPKTPGPPHLATPRESVLLEPVLIAGTVAAAVAVLAIVHLNRPLWVDEITTLWFTDGDWSSMSSRLSEFSTQSRLYPTFMWVWVHLIGSSPFLLRLPSALAVLVAATMVRLMARRVAGAHAGWIAVGLFIVTTEVFVSAGNARAYGLALAVIAAMQYHVLRWIENGSPRRGVAVVGLAVLAVHLHVLMILGVLPLSVAAFLRGRRSGRWVHDLRWPLLSGIVFGSTLLLTVLGTAENRDAYDPNFDPTLRMLVTIALEPSTIVVLGIAVLLGGGLVNRGVFRSDAVAYLSCAAAFPLVSSWSLARFLGLGVFFERYLVSVLPAIAVLLAIVVVNIRRPVVRSFAFAGIAALGLVQLAVGAGGSNNWEAAVTFANTATTGHDAVVLVEPMHIMGREQRFFVDDDGHWIFDGADSLGWVNPIETAHPIDAPSYGLPYAATSWGVDYLDAVLAARLHGADMVVLIGKDPRPEVDYTELVRDRMAARGFAEQPTPELDREVLLFTRD